MTTTLGIQRDEKGQSISLLVAISVVALLAIAGLVVDGGAHSAATRNAQQAATSAARASVDAAAPARAAGEPVPGGEMIAAGRQVFAAAGVEGRIEIVSGRVRVETTVTVPTILLGIIGIESLTARGAAEATLLTP